MITIPNEILMTAHWVFHAKVSSSPFWVIHKLLLRFVLKPSVCCMCSMENTKTPGGLTTVFFLPIS
jgi:hypothetical protein